MQPNQQTIITVFPNEDLVKVVGAPVMFAMDDVRVSWLSVDPEYTIVCLTARPHHITRQNTGLWIWGSEWILLDGHQQIWPAVAEPVAEAA